MSFRFVLRSKREIKRMRVAGLVVWEAHQSAARMISAGVTTAEINQVYIDVFARHEATPLFLNYGGTNERPPFPAEICASVNDEVVHGIPSDRELVDGDIIAVDTGCRVNGWCGDAAVTHAIGEIDDEANYLSPSLMGNEDFELRPGLVLAVEPMVNAGVKEILEEDDGWTIVTGDAKPSAHFEHTLAITADGVQRLTGPPNDEELASMPEWLHDSSKWLRW